MAKFGGSPQLLILCALALAAAAAAAAQSPPFVRRYGKTLVAGADVFLFNGFNAYWLMDDAAATYSNGSKVTEQFQEAAAAGLTVCRTWAFNDGGEDALQVTPGVYNEQVFKGLDFVIAEAANKGLRLILSLVNNYIDYGGRAQYVDWARRAGLAVSGDDDFYTHSIIKGYFKEHIEHILNRVNTITNITYKDDPTIMAWELMNEPHCESDPSGKIVTAWVQEMATFTKSIDSKHLLGVGLEGFYGSSTPDKMKLYNPNSAQIGVDFMEVHKVNEIDYSTIHAYPDSWLSGQSEEKKTEFVRKWLWSHWKDSVEVLGKPLMLGEFGKTRIGPGNSVQVRDAFYSSVYGSIYGLSKSGNKTFTGGLNWHLLTGGMESYDDGFGIFLSQDADAAVLIQQQSANMKALAAAAAA